MKRSPFRVFVATLFVACGAPSAEAPAVPIASAPPAPVVAASATASVPLPPEPAIPVTPQAHCAQLSVDLPIVMGRCTEPGMVDYADGTETDLDIDVTPDQPTVKAGGSIDFVVTIRNRKSTPMLLWLSDSQVPTFDVYDANDRPVGPSPGGPPTEIDRRCERVTCPEVRTPPSPPPKTLTLAPGGVARARATWSARQLGWPKEKVRVGCCEVDARAPVDAGPLKPGSYRVLVRPPLGAYDAGAGVTRARADVEVVK